MVRMAGQPRAHPPDLDLACRRIETVPESLRAACATDLSLSIVRIAEVPDYCLWAGSAAAFLAHHGGHGVVSTHAGLERAAGSGSVPAPARICAQRRLTTDCASGRRVRGASASRGTAGAQSPRCILSASMTTTGRTQAAKHIRRTGATGAGWKTKADVRNTGRSLSTSVRSRHDPTTEAGSVCTPT